MTAASVKWLVLEISSLRITENELKTPARGATEDKTQLQLRVIHCKFNSQSTSRSMERYTTNPMSQWVWRTPHLSRLTPKES